MAVTPFTLVGELTAIAELYINERFIADRALPRVRTSTEVYRFRQWPLESRFTVPDTFAHRLSPPNKVQDLWTEGTGTTRDFGLDHPVPVKDQMNAAADGMNMQLNATSYVTQLILLDREVRAAGVIFNAANYGAGLTLTLGAGTQWDDPLVNPVIQIKDNMALPLVRPNKMVLGLEAWNALCTNPFLVESIRGGIFPANNAAQAGITTESQVAALFGLDEVLVGDSRHNTAKEGATPTIVRVFNDSAALLHINDNVRTTNDMIVTWGYTAQFGERVAGTIQDPNMGIHGGVWVRVGESVNEQVIAPSAGFLFLDTVS